MTRDEVAAMWVFVCGWLPGPTLNELLAAAREAGEESLCGLLYQRRLLDADQVARAREATAQAIASGVDRDATALQATFWRLRSQELQAAGPRGLPPLSRTSSGRYPAAEPPVAGPPVAGPPITAPPDVETVLLRSAGHRRPALQTPSGSFNEQAFLRSSGELRRSSTGRYYLDDEDAETNDLQGRLRSYLDSDDSSPTVHERALPRRRPSALGDYQLIEEMANGSMGSIFRAVHRPTGRTVALKRMRLDDGLDPEGETIARRFQREAEVLVHLKHPNIVEIFDVGFEAQVSYYAMELIVGRDLKTLVKQGLQEGERWPWLRSAELIAALAGALAYCHSQGITHRDIKPQNILVEEGTDRAVLIDFGLLKRASELGSQSSGSSSGLTPSGTIVGTPAFMAPEQAAPDGAFGVVGEHSDIWGLGATLFYCLTGVPPFNRPNLLEILEAVQSSREAPRVRWINPEVPPWLDELCARCLEKDPARRPAAAELSAELGRGLQRHDGSRRRAFAPLAAALALVLGFAGAVLWRGEELGPRERLRFAVLDRRGRLTASETARVLGMTVEPFQRLFIGERSLVTDSDGRFEALVELRPGANRIEVRPEGAAHPEVILTIERDSDAPTIVIDNPRLGPGRYALIDGALRGRLIERNPRSLRVNGRGHPLKSERRFTIPVAASFLPVTLELEAIDALGQKSAEPAVVFPEELEPGPRGVARAAELVELAGALGALVSDPTERARVAPLFERRRWAAARSADQERIARWAARRLGAELRFKGLEDFAAGDAKHRIAVFSHASGALFHLLPGDFIDVELWDDPRREYLDACLTNLLDSRFDPDALAFALEQPPFKNFREALARMLNIEDKGEPGWMRSWRRLQGMQVREEATFSEQAERRLKEDPAAARALREALEDRRARNRSEHPPERRRAYIKPFLLARAEQQSADGALLAGLDDDEARGAARRLGAAFRLPSRLEWRYAYHAGASGRFFWGDDPETGARLCRLSSTSDGPRPAGAKPGRGNAFGLVDMAGNLAEWCELPGVEGELGVLLGGDADRGVWCAHPELPRFDEGGWRGRRPPWLRGSEPKTGLRPARDLDPEGS